MTHARVRFQYIDIGFISPTTSRRQPPARSRRAPGHGPRWLPRGFCTPSLASRRLASRRPPTVARAYTYYILAVMLPLLSWSTAGLEIALYICRRRCHTASANAISRKEYIEYIFLMLFAMMKILIILLDDEWHILAFLQLHGFRAISLTGPPLNDTHNFAFMWHTLFLY